MKIRMNAAKGLKLASTMSAFALLSACGGGGGGGPISTPAPAPAPAPSPAPSPSPTPTPPPTNFDTAEFRRSDGPDFHNAVTAWQSGATGRSETIAVIDTGIDIDSPEFAGRIHPDSRDVVSNRSVYATDDHGTNVAMVAAAARNGTGILGIAFDATLLALRADSVNSCATDSPADPSLDCSFDDRDIAAGVDQAIASGATVINISLGGGAATNVLRQAVARAAAAGIVIVVSAGNAGDGSDPAIDPDQPDPFASSLLSAGNGNVIIVGSVDENGQYSDFSNRAGNDAASYLTARGERVCCVYENGSLYITTENGQQFVTLFSGTSFSAPQVAGAVALLAQAFPNLTGAQMVQILLDSARDAGASGTDAVFGRGILDIAAAFAPAGTTTLAGQDTALALADDVVIGSAAMGDALRGQGLQTIVLDKYKRAYAYDAGSRLRSANVAPRLAGAIESGRRRVSAGSENLSLGFTIDESSATAAQRPRQLQLSQDEAVGARVLAARIAARLSPQTQFGFAFAEGASGLVAQLQGQDRPAFLIAPNARGDDGFFSQGDFGVAVRHRTGPWGLTLSAQQGQAWLGRARRGDDVAFGRHESRKMTSFGAEADRQFGALTATLGMTWLSESDTVLGAYFHNSLGARGADTIFADIGLRGDLGGNWNIGGDFRQGFTRARTGGSIASGSNLSSNAWSVDLTRSQVTSPSDSLGFRLSQPLRVANGGLNLALPVRYDYATETPEIGISSLSLAPTGREVMGELAWRGPFMWGYASASVFYRRQPGHIADSPDDAGVALRWNTQF